MASHLMSSSSLRCFHKKDQRPKDVFKRKHADKSPGFLYYYDVDVSTILVEEVSNEYSETTTLRLFQLPFYPLPMDVPVKYGQVTFLEVKAFVQDVSHIFHLASILPNLQTIYFGQTTISEAAKERRISTLGSIKPNPSIRALNLKMDGERYNKESESTKWLIKKHLKLIIQHTCMLCPELKEAKFSCVPVDLNLSLFPATYHATKIIKEAACETEQAKTSVTLKVHIMKPHRRLQRSFSDDSGNESPIIPVASSQRVAPSVCSEESVICLDKTKDVVKPTSSHKVNPDDPRFKRRSTRSPSRSRNPVKRSRSPSLLEQQPKKSKDDRFKDCGDYLRRSK